MISSWFRQQMNTNVPNMCSSLGGKKVSEDRRDELKSNQPENLAMSFNRNLQREFNLKD